jgi:hypothetical protein
MVAGPIAAAAEAFMLPGALNFHVVLTLPAANRMLWLPDVELQKERVVNI